MRGRRRAALPMAGWAPWPRPSSHRPPSCLMGECYGERPWWALAPDPVLPTLGWRVCSLGFSPWLRGGDRRTVRWVGPRPWPWPWPCWE